MFYLLSLTVYLSLMFIIFKHPLSLGLILLLQTFSITMITGLMNYNFFYSYILFLIMIGGMLILFIYMTSIASNEKFNFNFNSILTLMLIMMPTMFIIYDPIYSNFQFKLSMLNTENLLTMQKFINLPNMMMLMMMIMYLLLTLIAAVKISNIKYGSLRQKF